MIPRKINGQAIVCALLICYSEFAYAQTNDDVTKWLSVITSYLLDEEPPEFCTQYNEQSVDIVDLDHLVLFPTSPYSCSGQNLHSCVARKIRAALPAGCRTQIDIFVPGTNQEQGDWKQFSALVDPSDTRGTLSLGYSKADFTDTINYDRGVRKSRDALGILLDVIQEEFSPESVRIYGHSKGSHGVALSADRFANKAGFENYHFFAFGQAGRTQVKIDDTDDMLPGKRGSLGYIERLSSNLVGIVLVAPMSHNN